MAIRKSFLHKMCGAWHLFMTPVSNPRKFSLRKSYFAEVFFPQKFSTVANMAVDNFFSLGVQLSLHIISSCVLWAVYTSHRNAKALGMLRHPLVCGLDKPVKLNYITQVTFITADSAHETYVGLIGLGRPHTQAPSQSSAWVQG